MKPVTLWYTVQNNKTIYNHLEDGHCPNDVPTPKFKEQKSAWKSQVWKKEFKHLNGENVVVD